MTGIEEAQLNMFRATNQVGTDNNGIVITIPNLATGFTDLKTRINGITGLVSLQAAVISGIAIDKKDLKNKMAKLCYNYAGPGRAWAASLGDDTNYNALDLSITKILRAPDDVAGPTCQVIHGILNTNALALLPFGLTAAMINELNTAITDYMAIVPLPTNAINIRQTYTDNISEKIKETSLFLERQLDNIVRGQINANADFVKTYFNGREIIDPPTNSTTFKITVFEFDPTSPDTRGTRAIANVRAQVLNTDKISHTDESGKCALKQFKKGEYTILVSKDGYLPEQQTVMIGLGETKELIFSLKKA